MSKQITITFRDYVFNKYLGSYNGNKSAYIEEMFVRGNETETSDIKDLTIKYLEVNKELKKLEEENAELKRKIGKYKQSSGGRTPEEAERWERQKAMIEGLRRNNPGRFDGL